MTIARVNGLLTLNFHLVYPPLLSQKTRERVTLQESHSIESFSACLLFLFSPLLPISSASHIFSHSPGERAKSLSLRPANHLHLNYYSIFGFVPGPSPFKVCLFCTYFGGTFRSACHKKGGCPSLTAAAKLACHSVHKTTFDSL